MIITRRFGLIATGVPRFYDISGMTHDPAAFQMCIDIFVKRYANLNVDLIAGLDARGFVLGPPIALALKKPFVMLRKKGKLPNAITGTS
jgi:adenine phosphoribosyltransferase